MHMQRGPCGRERALSHVTAISFGPDYFRLSIWGPGLVPAGMGLSVPRWGNDRAR